MSAGRSQFTRWLENVTLDVVEGTLKNKEDRVWPKIFKKMKTRGKEAFVRLIDIEAPGYAGYIPAGGAPPEDTVLVDREKEIHVKRYGIMDTLDADMMDDERDDKAIKRAEYQAFSVDSTIEELHADVFNDGFSAADDKSNLAADGVVYFSTNHYLADGGTTFDTVASDTTLELTYTNFWNEVLAIRTDHNAARGHQLSYGKGELILLIGEANFKRAYEILNSPGQQPGTANFNPNVVDSLKVRLVVSPYITSTYWFVIDAKNNPFVSVWRKQPTVSRDTVFTTDGGRFKTVFRCAAGAAFMRGCRGNQGATS